MFTHSTIKIRSRYCTNSVGNYGLCEKMDTLFSSAETQPLCKPTHNSINISIDP